MALAAMLCVDPITVVFIMAVRFSLSEIFLSWVLQSLSLVVSIACRCAPSGGVESAGILVSSSEIS